MSRINALKTAQIDLKNKLRLLDNRYGENSPINNNLLPNMPHDSKVIMSDKVKEYLELIQHDTKEQPPKEIPFLLFGKTYGQTVIFDDIVADFEDLDAMEANHSKLVPYMQDFIRKSKKDGTDIIAHGHSHPKSINNYHLNFSLGDMNTYKKFRFDNDIFNSGKIELCSCLLTDGNYNFLFFDGNDYYKFNDVFVQNANGNIIQKLPCYNQKFDLSHDLARE